MSESSSEDASSRAREEINRLLLSAGYFRVRMPDLDDFDKVAGGLSWALKASTVDVNVDIFFKEKPNIGEKIRISDSIITALRKSGCPYNLSPHQIQGLDFPQLFPVVQWLVKKVIATREEFGDFQRSYAEFSFNNRYANLPSDVLLKQHSHSSSHNIHQMKQYYPPKRYYKRNEWFKTSELKHIETTLLEYGRIPTLITSSISVNSSQPQNAQSTPDSPRHKSSLSQANSAEQESPEITEQRNIELKQALSTMQRQTDDTADLDSSIINNIVSRNEEIAAAHSIFEAQKFDVEVSITESELRANHSQQMEKVTSRLSNAKAEGRKVTEEYNTTHSKLEEVTQTYEEQKIQNEKLKQTIKKYNEIINQSQHTEELMRAISVRDNTQEAIESFKNQCQSEMKEWQRRIQILKEKQNGTGDNVTNDDRLYATLEQYEHEWEQKQVMLSEKARIVLKLRTEYDSVPTLAELTQYDRRLNELSTQSLHELTELKKRTQLCNALIESEEVLEKENELFNSILKSFNQAKNSQQMQRALVQQMEEISKQASAKKEKVLEEIAKKREALAKLDEQHRKLLESQRRYFQAVKEYQDLYDRLESLREDEEEDE
ncbi:Coiled-coil domain-containing protein [Histomonas meleagridis]|uniref:Coiled-coil domain-containing protein 93 n=1 Tax=Histomonas meleagridis TaxID=135588 RepID=UPI003559ADAC|nr:Coiled-coil domain-containing protein [Histomonas meleagridis]KAH0803329.1 Coiled-coil domain-containing protein 93 [Histomonas meleagridis]